MKHLEATLLFNFDFFLLYFLTRWTFFFAWRSFMSLHFSIDVLCMYELWIFLFWKIRCLIAHHHHSSFFTLRVPLWDLRDADNIINHIFLYHVWRSTVLFLLAASFSSIYWRSNGAFIHFWNSFYQGLLQPPENWGCVWFLRVLKKPLKRLFFGGGDFIAFLCDNDLKTGRTYVHPQNQTCGAPAWNQYHVLLLVPKGALNKRRVSKWRSHRPPFFFGSNSLLVKE